MADTTSAVASTAATVATGFNPWAIAAVIGGNIIQALTYDAPDVELTPEQKEYQFTVERYRAIAEREKLAITMAANITGLPESTFYGRKGQIARQEVQVSAPDQAPTTRRDSDGTQEQNTVSVDDAVQSKAWESVVESEREWKSSGGSKDLKKYSNALKYYQSLGYTAPPTNAYAQPVSTGHTLRTAPQHASTTSDSTGSTSTAINDAYSGTQTTETDGTATVSTADDDALKQYDSTTIASSRR